MTTASPSRNPSVRQAFEALRKRGGIGLVPFIPAGYPDLKTTAACLLAAQRGGGTIIELGFPFSDPIADGPVIQESFTRALANKLTISEIFETVASIRDQLTVPLVSMVSYSIVFRFGVERFAKTAYEAGFSGLIIPDLPPPEAQLVCKTIQAAGLETILLIAPSTSPERRKEIAELCTGFIYYLSVAGITGERDALPENLTDNVRQIRELTDRPICVGFGIHRAEHLEQLRGKADGAIVGSAYVKRMTAAIPSGSDSVASAVETYTRELLGSASNKTL